MSCIEAIPETLLKLRRQEKDFTGKIELLQAVKDASIFRELLESISLDEVKKELDYIKRTCLTLAVRGKSTDVVKILLEKFENHKDFIDHKDIVESSALTYAAEFGFANIVEILLEAGADPESQDHFGNTPIIWAAKRGRCDCLVIFGKRVKSVEVWEIKGEDGLDAKGWANRKGHLRAENLIGRIMKSLRDAAGQPQRSRSDRDENEEGGEGKRTVCVEVSSGHEDIHNDQIKSDDSGYGGEIAKKLQQLATQSSEPKNPKSEETFVESEGSQMELTQPSSPNLNPNPSLTGTETDSTTSSSESTECKRALISYNDFTCDPGVSCRMQALEAASTDLSLSFRRCDFDVTENGRPKPENLTADIGGMIATSGIDNPDTKAAALGVLEFCQLNPEQRLGIMEAFSQRDSLLGKPKWIVDQGFAPDYEDLRGRCAYLFSNTRGDTDTNGSYLTETLLAEVSQQGALDAGLDEMMNRVVDAVKLASSGEANPQFRNMLAPGDEQALMQ